MNLFTLPTPDDEWFKGNHTPSPEKEKSDTDESDTISDSGQVSITVESNFTTIIT